MLADSGLAPFELLTFVFTLCRHRNRDLHHGLLALDQRGGLYVLNPGNEVRRYEIGPFRPVVFQLSLPSGRSIFRLSGFLRNLIPYRRTGEGTRICAERVISGSALIKRAESDDKGPC